MFLALFPLQLVIFPGESIPLHIFEPRYKQLIAECRDDGMTFGIPAFLAGKVSKFGTEVELVRLLEVYDNGEMDVIVRGLRAFRIDSLQRDVPGKLYSGALVSLVHNDPAHEPKMQEKLLKRFERYLRMIGKKFTIPDAIPENLSFLIAARVRLTLDQRLTLLGVPRETDRQALLLKHLDRVSRAVPLSSSPPLKVGGNGKVRSVSD